VTNRIGGDWLAGWLVEARSNPVHAGSRGLVSRKGRASGGSRGAAPSDPHKQWNPPSAPLPPPPLFFMRKNVEEGEEEERRERKKKLSPP